MRFSTSNYYVRKYDDYKQQLMGAISLYFNYLVCRLVKDNQLLNERYCHMKHMIRCSVSINGKRGDHLSFSSSVPLF